jgi:hypothetical protein
MLLFSLALSVPLALSSRRLGALEGLLGAANIVLGCWIAVETLS